MRLNLFRRSKTEDQAPEKIEVPKSLRESVFEAPADHNRATRRAVGMLSKVWRWATPAEMGNQVQAPRYIRRHYDDSPTAFSGHKTRRQRKARARIVRIILAKGIA